MIVNRAQKYQLIINLVVRKHNNVFEFSLLKDNLTELFSDQDFVMRLSSITRIYPEYYTPRMLKIFLQSEDNSKYLRYIAKLDKDKEKAQKTQKNNNDNNFTSTQNSKYSNKKSFPSQQLFQAFPTYKKSLPILDCYIDWLMKQKLPPHSNEYYKNKCIMEMFDMRNPQNWFINNQKRHFIYHHGPTNSGKTSSAIKELKQLSKDKKGIYMAPLRLLAWEMQQKLQNCNLITGQDKQFRVSNLTSCTIQALNTNEEYDVAIIDEIQMIGDYERGWSWTKAILSTKAKKIHLCGDERAIGLVSKLIQDCGGTLQERKYSRLGKLKLIPKIFEMNAISEGDCMIEFSVETLHKLRRKIREEISRREKQKQSDNHVSTQENTITKQISKPLCPIAMVYGRLPPQCRKQEARKFNQKISPYLVATNAIGMGLNLNIKKIIFAGIKRRNSRGEEVELEQHQIQQIAGRAGRGLNDGLVQCASYDILKKVRKALRNVNKTYGINLQDEQLFDDKISNKTSSNDDEQDNPNTTFNAKKDVFQNILKNGNKSSLENYDNFLNRVLTQKERSIQKAGLFVEYIFLKRMKDLIEEHYYHYVPLHASIKLYMNLSLQSSDLYLLTEKTELIEWLKKLQKVYNFDSRDIFQIAKCLSMHYNSFYAREKMSYFAKMFKRKCVVPVPVESIKKRNEKKVSNNYTKLDILQSNYSVAEVYINLWNKYEFIYSELQTAKQIKEQIAEMIKVVLQDEQGFSFDKNKDKCKCKSQQNQQEKQLNSELDERENVRQTILDEQTSDIQQIKIGNY